MLMIMLILIHIIFLLFYLVLLYYLKDYFIAIPDDSVLYNFEVIGITNNEKKIVHYSSSGRVRCIDTVCTEVVTVRCSSYSSQFNKKKLSKLHKSMINSVFTFETAGATLKVGDLFASTIQGKCRI